MSLYSKIMGRSLATSEEGSQKVGALAGIPMLGLDSLSSAAYGPEAALTVLLALGALGTTYILPITLIIIALLVIVYFSYRQTIAAYPNGGGSYTVAKENLGVRFGLIAAASLILDYTLNVAVGIAAGVGALVSVAPMLHPYILPLCLLILGIITLVNLHGIRESGTVFIIPTYLFVGTLGAVIIIGIAKSLLSHGHPLAVEVPPSMPIAAVGVSFWLLLRSFANGCTAMTGVEAISNGVTAFEEPAVRNAQRTLTGVIFILCLLLAGIAFLCRTYGIGATDPDSAGYQSILSQLTAAVAGRGIFYYVTMGSVISIVCLSANTSFAGFPRLCRLLATDNFLPYAFAIRGRRLVYSEGVIGLAAMSCALLVIFDGITDRLIPLFAIGAFAAFTLSQAGMVAHWLKQPATDSKGNKLSMLVNGVGAVSTCIVLFIVMIMKFSSGAWIALMLIASLFWFFLLIKRHYTYVEKRMACVLPVDLEDLQPPVVVIVVKRWNATTRKALRFALEMSSDIIAVHINSDDNDANNLKSQWHTYVEEPLRLKDKPIPRLIVVESPYRRFFHPLFDTIKKIEKTHAGRTLAIVVPELMGGPWYDYFLHNQTPTILKAALLLRDDQRITVVNVPWYLDHEA
ncbi:MAG: APC family permease [Alphaproteobacteria bacterium]